HVTANGSTTTDAVTNVAITGTTATLTLTTPITNAQSASVAYVQPGTANLQDALGNLVANFSLNATLDTTPPSEISGAADGTSLTLQFDEPLNDTSVPAPSAFAVNTVSGGTPTADPVTAVAISGSTVTLSLTNTVAGSQTVTIAYTQP